VQGFRNLLIFGQSLEIGLKLPMPVLGQSMSSEAELMKMSGSRITRHLVATFLAGAITTPLMAYPLVPAECRGREVECAQKQELSYIHVQLRARFSGFNPVDVWCPSSWRGDNRERGATPRLSDVSAHGTV
jgi:hypothetical protein